MTTAIIYGIKQCDTVKKALKWLDAKHISYQFHDVRKDGISAELLRSWLKQVDRNNLINKKSTSWRALSQSEKDQALEGDVIEIFLTHPTLIKRPVTLTNNHIYVGFSDKSYSEIFARVA